MDVSRINPPPGLAVAVHVHPLGLVRKEFVAVLDSVRISPVGFESLKLPLNSKLWMRF